MVRALIHHCRTLYSFFIVRRASIYINYSSGGTLFILSLTTHYLTASSKALYLFESCLVFSREIEVVWRRRWSAITWIYVLSHYSSLLLTIFSIVPIWGFVVRASYMSFHLLPTDASMIGVRAFSLKVRASSADGGYPTVATSPFIYKMPWPCFSSSALRVSIIVHIVPSVYALIKSRLFRTTSVRPIGR